MGIFAAAFIDHFPLIPVEDDGRLHDPQIRENFIERVFVFRHWKKMLKENTGVKGLVEFHTSHKLLLMAHSQKHYSLLGKMVAGAGNRERKKFHHEYITLFMEALKLQATSKKNTNVLMHLAGYFKKNLTSDEIPITLLNHFVRKYEEPYLKKQYYLNPHPAELMLRNHV
jgi:uncharacterized protein YbgA (DUF1722 family)